MHFPSRHQSRHNDVRDREYYLPTVLPECDTVESDTTTVSMTSSPLKVLKGVVTRVLIAAMFGCFGVFFYLSMTDVNAIQGQYIVQLDRNHYSNHSGVRSLLANLDEVAIASGADFVLLQEYANLGPLGVLSLSVQMSDSIHKTLLHTDGILVIEPDLRVQVRDEEHLLTSLKVSETPAAAVTFSEEDDKEAEEEGGAACQQQWNAKW